MKTPIVKHLWEIHVSMLLGWKSWNHHQASCIAYGVFKNVSDLKSPGPWFNIKMLSYQCRKYHCGDKTIFRPSYLNNGIPYTAKTTTFYWIGALLIFEAWWHHIDSLMQKRCNTSALAIELCIFCIKPSIWCHVFNHHWFRLWLVFWWHQAIIWTLSDLTHWDRVTHICVSDLTDISSDNGLSPGRCQAIIWTNAGLLLIRTLGTNFSEILSEINTFSFKKMCLKISSAKWRPFV